MPADMPMINVNTFPYFDENGMYQYGSLNSGDTAWMLAATALVLFMTMPGLAIYYSGMVRDKNVLAGTRETLTLTLTLCLTLVC
jgi:hypothetical protein